MGVIVSRQLFAGLPTPHARGVHDLGEVAFKAEVDGEVRHGGRVAGEGAATHSDSVVALQMVVG